jgi:hypothetical protein
VSRNTESDLMTKFIDFLNTFTLNRGQNNLTEKQKYWAAIDKTYVTPPFNLQNIPENKKLSGSKNFKLSKTSIELDLEKLLTSFHF